MKPTRSAIELQQLLSARLDDVHPLQGQLTEAHRLRVIGSTSEAGGSNWIAWSPLAIEECRDEVVRIIRSLQSEYDLAG